MKTWFAVAAMFSVLGAHAQAPAPLWRFRGLKEDYVRIARENLGIVRHVGKRLPTGFVREFGEDFNNSAILYLATQDKSALDRYSAALGYLAGTRWGIDRVGGYDYNCDGGTITELVASYELMRPHLAPELQKAVEGWLYEWARIRADESIMKRADWTWDQRLNQQNYGGALAAVARLLAGRYDVAPLTRWINGSHEFHTYWANRQQVVLNNALGWDTKSRPGDDAITQYSNWDAMNLFEISRAKGIDPAQNENTRRYFNYFLLLTAPNGARARFGHDYQRDSVAAVFAYATHILRDGRYKYALNRVGQFSLDNRYRFPQLDRLWDFADDELKPVEPRKKSAYIETPQTDYTAVGKTMPDKIVFRDGWNPADDAFLYLDLRHSGQHTLADSQMLGAYIWRDTPWLTNTSERALHMKDVDFRWQENALLIRKGSGARAAEYLKHRDSDRASADVQSSDVEFQEFADAAFSRSRMNAAGFEQTRALWHLEHGYTVVFDSAKAREAGVYTVGAAWHTPQQVRVKTKDMALLEDGAENRLSVHWFAGQTVVTALDRRTYKGTPEASPYFGNGREITALFQASAGSFAVGQRWNIANLLLPRRKATYSTTALSKDPAYSAIRVEQPDTVEIAAVSFEPGLHRFDRVSTDAEAVLAQWSRKFAGPVRVRYVNGKRIQVETGLAPESIVLRTYKQQPWYADKTAEANESRLDRKQWSFSNGRTEITLPAASGEIEIRFAPPERAMLNLNQGWKHLGWDTPNAQTPGLDDSAWRAVQLPYSVKAREGGAVDVNWYRKRFTLPAEARGKQVFLDFEGVAIQCDVWVNGRKAGDHLGAFNSFRFDITALLNPPGRENVLAVRVDFSAGWRYKIPFLPEGFNDNGGIYRDVWLTYTDPLHVDSVIVTTPDVSLDSGTVRIQARVRNDGTRARSARLVSVIYDAGQREAGRVESALEVAPGSEREVAQSAEPIAKPRLWSPDAPNLYTVVTQVVENGRTVDAVRNPLGFRWFRFDPDKGFFLNGEHLKLRGANMHQGYPFLGNAVPNSKMPFDLHVLKAMGANWLRTTHITMDPVVLEMADRLGLLVWEEIPVAGFGNGSMGDPVYDEAARQQMREMIRRDRNHPSIILWATMNEAAGGESRKRLSGTLKLCRELHDIAHAEDPARLTAIAETVDAFFGITDISGRNGYYRGANLYVLGAALDKIKREHPQSRVLISEYGAPNVERGSFGIGRTDTEEYAALVHEQNDREYASRDWIAGQTIWNAFDYFHGNPHEGVTDEARYPKDAYFYYQSRWSPEPMLRIRGSAHWSYPAPEGRDRRTGAAYDVAVDSNCDQVELFLNGRSQGVRNGPGPFVWRQLVYAPGMLKAVGRKGNAVIEHTRSTAEAPYRVVLTADTYELAADGRDVAYLQARVVDAEGRLVANSYDTVQFTVEGEGTLVCPSSQKLLAGVATLASVQAGSRTGEIHVTARVGRLRPEEILIRSTDRKSSVNYE